LKTHLVSFGTPEFAPSVQALARSAEANGVDECRAWDVSQLQATPFHEAHRSILTQRRGAGYWLWKPYIIKDALDRARDEDIVVYADAGVTILEPLTPLLELCRAQGGVLLFAGHYDRPGRPNVCATWTKRDCFVRLGCDEPVYHRAPMLDAAFLLFARNSRAMSLVDEWLASCVDPRILTDMPNECGRPNLPGFVEHRHDQSVLSLLAARDARPLFRGPSQHGNHCKTEAFRRAGEWLKEPYDAGAAYASSAYPTLLFHHRLKQLAIDPQTATHVREALGYAEVVRAFARSVGPDVPLLHIGADGEAELAGIGGEPMTCDRSEASWASLGRSSFRVVVTDARTTEQVLADLERIVRYRLLARGRWLIAFSRLEGIDGWAASRSLGAALSRYFEPGGVHVDYGLVASAAGADHAPPRPLAILISRR
jgi:hypothetical protein